MSAPATAADPRAVRFVLDGEIVTVSGLPPTTTVLEYLRNVAGRTGAKEGCAEGDCGACTVVLGELSEDGASVHYQAVNACIRFLPTIDGKELITVESLQEPDGALHPVQQAMVDQHASQCGFCTPGFVMSLFALYLKRPAPQRAEVVDALAGNLCRCTGYRPIIDAGLRMGRYPEPARWSRGAAGSAGRIAKLRAIQRNGSNDKPLQFSGFRAPRTLGELAAALDAAPHSLILAGGTDVGLWVTKKFIDMPPMIYIGEIAELRQIRSSASELWIGAGVRLSDAWPALSSAYPELTEQARRFASPPICNSATLCGNLANGSPIGDSMPALIALGAEIDLRRGARSRRIALDRFYLGYQKKDLSPGEFVVGVAVPARRPGCLFASYKLAKRFDQDISAVSAGFAVTVEADRVTSARLAYGGMAPTPMRALKAEAALVGQPWSAESIDGAIAALAQDFTPLTDMRASSEYRLKAAGNLLWRFYLEHAHSAVRVRTADALAAME